MDLREITIGRSRNCDIFLDPQCQYASNMHATIYYNGQHLVYRDTSTNGTIINGRLYKHQEVVIHRGDQIVLAGKYMLPWAKIDSFFPVVTGTMAQPQGATIPNYAGPTPAPAMEQPANDYVDTSGWSWGAFQIYPIWGFANGCWWAIFIYLGAAVLSYFAMLGMAAATYNPVISMFAGYVVGFIPSLLFGLFGRRWAWNNRNWSSGESFNHAQHVWNIWGLVLFIISTVFFVFTLIFASNFSWISAARYL